ncbi:MAG TPA: hypothetical protein VI636_05385 [Candidatus Angelobacter sp.]
MSDLTKAVHERQEEYKRGWVHGFYDAKPDDGAFYGAPENADHAISNGGPVETVRLYHEGYRDGQTVRLRRSLGNHSEISPNLELRSQGMFSASARDIGINRQS